MMSSSSPLLARDTRVVRELDHQKEIALWQFFDDAESQRQDPRPVTYVKMLKEFLTTGAERLRKLS